MLFSFYLSYLSMESFGVESSSMIASQTMPSRREDILLCCQEFPIFANHNCNRGACSQGWGGRRVVLSCKVSSWVLDSSGPWQGTDLTQVTVDCSGHMVQHGQSWHWHCHFWSPTLWNLLLSLTPSLLETWHHGLDPSQECQPELLGHISLLYSRPSLIADSTLWRDDDYHWTTLCLSDIYLHSINCEDNLQLIVPSQS